MSEEQLQYRRSYQQEEEDIEEEDIDEEDIDEEDAPPYFPQQEEQDIRSPRLERMESEDRPPAYNPSPSYSAPIHGISETFLIRVDPNILINKDRVYIISNDLQYYDEVTPQLRRGIMILESLITRYPDVIWYDTHSTSFDNYSVYAVQSKRTITSNGITNTDPKHSRFLVMQGIPELVFIETVVPASGLQIGDVIMFPHGSVTGLTLLEPRYGYSGILITYDDKGIIRKIKYTTSSPVKIMRFQRL